MQYRYFSIACKVDCLGIDINIVVGYELVWISGTILAKRLLLKIHYVMTAKGDAPLLCFVEPGDKGYIPDDPAWGRRVLEP